jgi:hypothetical protein
VTTSTPSGVFNSCASRGSRCSTLGDAAAAVAADGSCAGGGGRELYAQLADTHTCGGVSMNAMPCPSCSVTAAALPPPLPLPATRPTGGAIARVGGPETPAAAVVEVG